MPRKRGYYQESIETWKESDTTLTGEAKMTEENIFKDGGQFCMKGDPQHRPVDWYWFKNLKTGYPISYVTPDGCQKMSVTLSGQFSHVPSDSGMDLIPIPKPPEYIPWESPDDVPDGIVYLRCKEDKLVILAHGFGLQGINGKSFLKLFEDYVWHTDRKAKDGWQVCGKVKGS